MSLPTLPSSDGRPVPIRDAFKSVQGATAWLASLTAILGGWGLITATQGNAVVGLLGAVPGTVTLAGDVIRAFRVQDAITLAEAAVTPIDSPATVIRGQLVPLVPDESALSGQHRAH